MRPFRNFKIFVVFVLLLCILLLASMLFYFMFAFDDHKQRISPSRAKSSSPVIIVGFNEVRTKNETLKAIFQHKLEAQLQSVRAQQHFSVDETDTSPQLTDDPFIQRLKEDLLVDQSLANDYERVWAIAKKWVRARQTVPPSAPELGSIIRALESAKILRSDVSRKGTQLKLLLTLEGGQYVLFKPKRYERDYVTDDIYAGADRHNGEIVAFHLSRMVNMRYAPIVASRKLNVSSEIRDKASAALAATFVNQTEPQNGSRTRNCFYGECYYCNEYDLVCEDDTGLLEGALILLLPRHYQLQKLRNPWQRTYKKDLKAQWENDAHYCLAVQKTNAANQQRLLDFVDLAIFDYLIGNSDRHHFEVFKDVSNSALLLIDNGKSFGDAHHDEITILYPLLQCCMARKATFEQLHKLAAFKLSSIANYLLSGDQLWPLLTTSHLDALDRRLVNILAAFNVCFNSFNKRNVLKP